MNDNGQFYTIIYPESLVFAQWSGNIIAISTLAEFNAAAIAKGARQRQPHASISVAHGGWRNVHPDDRATSLVFTGRNDDAPDLMPARDWQDMPVLDISARGLLVAMSVLAWQRNRSPRLSWLFDDASGCMRAARAFMDASAWFWTQHDRKRAEWMAAQAATVGDGGVFHVPTTH